MYHFGNLRWKETVEKFNRKQKAHNTELWTKRQSHFKGKNSKGIYFVPGF